MAPQPPGTPAGEHPATSTGCFLNMITVRGHETDPARISIDQALLPALNGGPDCPAPALPSLQIGVEGQYGLCGRTACDFSRVISWAGGTALPPIFDPQACFDKMFVGTNKDAVRAAAQRAAQRKSVLDGVLAQLKSMSATLSPSDRGKLDEHTTLVRNLETRLQRLGKSNGPTPLACLPPGRPGPSAPLDASTQFTPTEVIQTHVPLFVDLMVAAFQCDITRSITFMLGNGGSSNDYGFLFNGDRTVHRGTANNGGDPASQAKVTTIDTWEIQQAASLLRRLDGMVESDGRSILDHTTFYLSSDIRGLILAEWDLPVLVAGGASGRLKIDGRHVNYIPQMPFPRPSVGPRSPVQTGRVFISMLQAHGIMQDTFGMATGGPLPELMA
jgi:hypothetical protein